MYWLPIRRLSEIGLSGAWGTLAIVAAAVLLLSPFALRMRRLTDSGRAALGWVALVGVAGRALVLRAGGGVPLPRGLGEWLGLASGLFWAVATTGIRAQGEAGPGESAFVFALGACAGALVVAAGVLEVWPVRRGAPWA